MNELQVKSATLQQPEGVLVSGDQSKRCCKEAGHTQVSIPGTFTGPESSEPEAGFVQHSRPLEFANLADRKEVQTGGIWTLDLDKASPLE